MDVEDGLLLVDKPKGRTSHQIVGLVRRLAKTRKVGHGGTLDPMATGVLVTGIGKATKLLTYVSGDSKTYDATIRLGVSTDSDDSDGSPTAASGALNLTRETLEKAIVPLTGEIMQVPSTVSAIKVDGKRAYALARAGEDVQLKARPAVVSRFVLLSDPHPTTANVNDQTVPVVDVDVRVDVSSGTYVRALARDLGQSLGVGGHLTALRRTSVGPFNLSECATPETLEETFELPIITMSQAVQQMFPTLVLGDEDAGRFRHGTPPKLDVVMGGAAAESAEAPKPTEGDVYAAFDHQEQLLGLVQVRREMRENLRSKETRGGALRLKVLNVFDAR